MRGSIREGGLVLLVENCEADQALALRAIRAADVPSSVVIAHDADEARAYLYSEGAYGGRDTADPAVIFIDVKLGRESGVDLVRALRRDIRTRVIPIVMMSGMVDERIIQECYLAGANSYLVKAVDMDEFMSTFRVAAVYWLAHNRVLENSTQRAQRYLA